MSVNNFEKLVEALNLTIRYLLDISRIAKYLNKEILSLFIIKQILLPSVILILSCLIDPFKESILVKHKVGLVNKDLPQSINIIVAYLYCLI